MGDMGTFKLEDKGNRVKFLCGTKGTFPRPRECSFFYVAMKRF
jgi:hypothetical protein